MGFGKPWLEYENIENAPKGETKWNFWKLFLYSPDGILAFSTNALAFVSIIGLVFCLLAFCIDCVYHCTDSDIRRSHIGLAFSGMYHFHDQRRTASLSGHCGAIYGQNVYGSENRPIYLIKGRILARNGMYHMKTKVSIIVPMYQAAAFLKKP